VLTWIGNEGSLFLYDPATGKPLPSLDGQPAKLDSLAFSPDGKFLAAVTSDHVRLWNLRTRKEVPCPGKDGSVKSVVFAPGGNLLAVKGDHEVRLWNLLTRQEVPCLTEKDGQVES